MSVSLEALAMAGVDSNDWAMDFEEWERSKMDTDVPPHLLADENEDEDVEITASNYYSTPEDGSLGRWCRKDGKADGVHCILGILYSLSKSIEKRACNGMSSVRIIVRTILGYLMVMTMKIISAQTPKL